MVQKVVNKSAKSPARPRRSQPNRDRILAAARRVFAAQGYDRATVRLVAAEAGTAPSMVIRYYGSKNELFAAAVQFDLRLPDLTGVPRGEIGACLTRHFLTRWEEAPSGGELGALVRAAISTDAARERLIEIFQRQLQVSIAAISGPEGADRRAALISSQFLGIALARYVLALPACVAMDHDLIIAHVGATVQAYLTKSISPVNG
ncbi:TetR/AcrR family transcriptional regulator [Mesorhizobium sp. INR15]|uniref:TetR/AcrR family transcriptional regulator n=1 Tax=Mesorhizobium sp. INR15 TaxID=2654248 RepID=UPI002155FC15|nr:TetR family transcriptional regulator [Mesorhizobium sp. INR15]